jgi:ABC-type polysaccharide/polyol phosphate export permease
VLHPVWQLQEWLANILMYNPLVPLLEMFRQSLLFAYEPGLPDATPMLLIFSLGSLLIGLSMVLANADELRTR